MDVLQGKRHDFLESQAHDESQSLVEYDASARKLEWTDKGKQHAVGEDAVVCITSGGASSKGYLVYVLDEGDLQPHWIDHRLPSELHGFLLKPATHLEKKLIWIISTGSGVGNSSQFFESNLRRWADGARQAGMVEKDEEHVPQYFETDSDQFIDNFAATEATQWANDAQDLTIVLLSGDGGIVDMINGLLRMPWKDTYCPPNIGLLPFGTGNALAHSSGITGDSTRGLRTLYTGRPRPLPTFKLTFHPRADVVFDQGRQRRSISASDNLWGAVVCSWGLHASLVADSDTAEYRKHGAERFKMAAKELLTPSDGSDSHTYKGKVSKIRARMDGTEEVIPLEREEHMYVVLTLVSNFEKDFMISPASKPLDGKLRLLHFGPMPAQEVMRILTLAYQGGKHVEEEAVGYEEVDGLRIEMHEEDSTWRRVCIDGKIVEVAKGGYVEVRKEQRTAVNLIVP